ncbi:MAG TPA: CHAD domain-containing protein [Candidatus Saccharimonadales bacterium]|nr:CHAD domain-containing protein [Candidatus Saccharimonadales bacterium]
MAATTPAQLNPAILSIRLLALLETIPDRSSKKKVHETRTTVRRLEAQLGDCPKKLAKSLKGLRKQAGKVRDIDVHLGILKEPLALGSRSGTAKPDGSENSLGKLRRFLKSERKSQSKGLRALVSSSAPLLKKKLPSVAQRASEHEHNARDANRLCARARKNFLQWTRNIPSDEARLHSLRINTKMLRYSLEPMEQFDEAAELASKFKVVQDAIGEWHDWATLAQLAERELKPATAKPIQRALQAGARREYRKALRAAQSVRTWMTKPVESKAATSKPVMSRPAMKKPAAHAPGSRSLRLVRKAG